MLRVSYEFKGGKNLTKDGYDGFSDFGKNAGHPGDDE
jgi:hypothetical protein